MSNLEIIRGINLLNKCGLIKNRIIDQGPLCIAIEKMPLVALKLDEDFESLYITRGKFKRL